MTTTTVVVLSDLLLDRNYLSVTSIRNTQSEKPPRSSAFFLRMLLISSSVVPSCSARAFISSSRSDSSSSLCSFMSASRYSASSSCIFLQISFMYSSSDRSLVVGVFPLAFIICGIFSLNLQSLYLLTLYLENLDDSIDNQCIVLFEYLI